LNRNRLLEDEAEEEEEEGVQAGLGDFGFGVSRARDDDEAVSDYCDTSILVYIIILL